MHAWVSHGRIAGKLRGHSLDEPSLADQIQLAADGPGEFVHQVAEAVEARIGNVPLSERGQVGEDREVGFDHRLDSGPSDFHDDGVA